MYMSRNNKQSFFEIISPLAPLILRVWLAQVFFFAGYSKVTQGFTAPEWFAALSFPPGIALLPADLNWFLVGYGEIFFALLLLVGFAGRFAILGLLFITWVAIYTVHFELGFAGWDKVKTDMGSGFKIPLMLAIMQVSLFFTGMGKWSLDYLFTKKEKYYS